MGLQKEFNIDHVLLFMSPEQSRFMGRALWAALDEVSRYFTPNTVDGWLNVPVASRSGMVAHVRANFRKWYVAPQSPTDIVVDESGTFRQLENVPAADLQNTADRRPSTYNHQSLGVGIAELLELESPILVFDQEINPPPNWRYMIWDSFPGGALISLAPIDPRYWGQDDEMSPLNRLQEIKQGVRAALMSVTGAFLGLSRCDNPSCFMFAGVDSVSRLAEMLSLGDEHQVGGLTRGRFEYPDADPLEIHIPHAVEEAS